MQIWRRTCVTSCPAGLSSKINLDLKNDTSAFSFYEYIWTIFTYPKQFFIGELVNHIGFKTNQPEKNQSSASNWLTYTILEVELYLRSRAKNNLGKTFKKGRIFDKHCLPFTFLQNRFPKALTWYFALLKPHSLSYPSQSGYRRYLYHQCSVQTIGGVLRAAARPWLIPAWK